MPNGLQQGTLVVGGVDYSQYLNPEGEDCQLGDTYELVEEDEDEEHNANKSTISASAKGNEQNDAPDDGEEEDDEEEEIELEEFEFENNTYYTEDPQNGNLYDCLKDGEIGEIVGHLENGSVFFS